MEIQKYLVQHNAKKAFLDSRDGEIFAVLVTRDGDVQPNFDPSLIGLLVKRTLKRVKSRSNDPYQDLGYLRYFTSEESLLALADLYTAGGENLLSKYSTVFAER